MSKGSARWRAAADTAQGDDRGGYSGGSVPDLDRRICGIRSYTPDGGSDDGRNAQRTLNLSVCCAHSLLFALQARGGS